MADAPDVTAHSRARVALETTLLLHGVPREESRRLARCLSEEVRAQGATPALVGVVAGRPVVGMTDADLDAMLARPAPEVRKLNTANLGPAMAAGAWGATTVSTTMELAAGAGVSVFATGGIGGVHEPVTRLDISADLIALTRFPVAVVASGCKSILNLTATREVLETLGVPVVGLGTDDFPAFYFRRGDEAGVGGVGKVDWRFDDVPSLARFVRRELARTGRGVLVCNPIPAEHEISPGDWARWLSAARARAGEAPGRDATPAVLAALHEVSGGATLRANIALVVHNAKVAGGLARAMV
jgi:pseudouridine-5'-phosphate glycosidase